jgi:NAD(P)-dependent dehydrogenase (short-subunit alcohol dehydrogenase family)
MLKKVVVILSITSDFGLELAKRYARDGYVIIGTYRATTLLKELEGLPDCHLIPCDISHKASIAEFITAYQKLRLPWDLFISCPCSPLPLGSFFSCDFDEWSDSIHINAIEQLRVLHALYPLRRADIINDVVFFAGGGVNNAVLNFSAYTVSKIMLIKMCELLDAENSDLNIFITGPGWTRTKTHYLTLSKVNKSDKKYTETLRFMESGAQGTSFDDIYQCIRWFCSQGRAVAGGRNFSVVSDLWKSTHKEQLSQELRNNIDMYKLRRCGNEWSESIKKHDPIPG